jgi:hypothetical protein
MTRCRIWAKGELLDGELLEFNDAKTCTVLIDGYQGSNTFDASCLVHQDAKILYMDAVDWAHEAVDVSIWPSQKMLLEGTPCAFECGVVKCEVRVIDWAHPQNFSLEQAEQEGPEARAKRYEGHIARYRQRIEAFQKTADLFRSERTEQCGVYRWSAIWSASELTMQMTDVSPNSEKAGRRTVSKTASRPCLKTRRRRSSRPGARTYTISNLRPPAIRSSCVRYAAAAT